jgi:hypothetical protein
VKQRQPVRKISRKTQTLRIYGGKKRIEFVKSLPCAACGVVGFSENAHVAPSSEKGTGYKASAKWIAPLCGFHLHPFGQFIGCHALYDEHRSTFDTVRPSFNPEAAAAATERAWKAFQEARK